MRARIAAAAVLVGGISALLLILGQSGTNPLFASVQEKLKEVRSVTFDVSVQRGDAPAETVHVKLLGEDLGRAEKPSGEFTIFDRKQRKMMEVTPDERKAVIRTNAEGENPIPNLFDMLLRASEKSVKELGDRKIDGKNVTGFVAELRGQEMDVWVDPATKLPVQIEQRQELKENIASRDPKIREQKVPERGAVIETVLSKFVYNAKLDPAQFRMAPPDGYEVEMRDLPSVEELSRRAREQEHKAIEQAREAARARREKKNP